MKISISSTKSCLQEQQHCSWKTGHSAAESVNTLTGNAASNPKWVSVGITLLITEVKVTLIVGNNSRNPPMSGSSASN